MVADQPLRVPIGPDADRWRTFPHERLLVAAARTVTSTVRLLDVLPDLLRGDERVGTVFAFDPSSAFNDGVYDLLRAAGCRIMPWEQLAAISPDLVMSASENIDVPDGEYPVLVLPHGVGFHKSVPDSRSHRERLSGVVSDALLESGRAWMTVSHPDQADQLARAHPKAAGRTLLVGDPCHDQLLASLDRRDGYRRALGLEPDHRLLVLSSTWRETSLLGQDPGLPGRLLAELPADTWRVAAIAHPNVWSAHGAWQLRTLQDAAEAAGLLMVPPVRDWQAVLIAADVVIGDHGSVTLYGAAVDRPLLLGAFGADAVPGTPMTELGRTAARLDRRRPLRGQVDEALAGHRPGRLAHITDRAFACPGTALAALRTHLYELLRLPEPAGAPPVPTYPPPRVRLTPPTALATYSGAAEEGGRVVVDVERFPAAVECRRPETPERFRHLSCAETPSDRGLRDSASVLTAAAPAQTAVTAIRWIEDTLLAHPGSRVAAVPFAGGCLVGLRDGRVVETAATGGLTDPALHAAVVYTLLRAGLPPAGPVSLRVGRREEDVELRVRPRPR
ncbi:CDP-glycerol glycerophosphotransferase family protein [Streptomyces sp. XD-27]|uniref:CDP-glycerol glycerophosphotransferase family protein n=1 Tax=Streptomyces sp. XD-27 TaxID=3062779 RepID=UPI0026F45346|nr:CDP-glycerol glycerophosphotransferase family protein [Streptomyces sp. XD-27]WKX68956.1 CDP-glycerol glycerophosphotransferase family protein [Streptomyces sp. XD-27]